MSYSHLIDASSSIAKDICHDNPRFVQSVNAVVPEAIGLAVNIHTCGNAAAVAAAKAATQVAIRQNPNAAAEIATGVAVGLAIDLATPVVLVGAVAVGAGYVTVKGFEFIGGLLSELLD